MTCSCVTCSLRSNNPKLSASGLGSPAAHATAPVSHLESKQRLLVSCEKAKCLQPCLRHLLYPFVVMRSSRVCTSRTRTVWHISCVSLSHMNVPCSGE